MISVSEKLFQLAEAAHLRERHAAQIAAAATRRHIVLAHDFGKERDYATDLIAHSFGNPDRKQRYLTKIQVDFLDRYPLGTSYHAQAEKITNRMGRLNQDYPDACLHFAGDGTGVGVAGYEVVMRAGAFKYGQNGVLHQAITLTNGGEITRGKLPWQIRVPKQTLVRGTQEALAVDALILPPESVSPMVAILRNELKNYTFKVTERGHIGAEAARDSVHDDLVMALCMGVFKLQWRLPKFDKAGNL